MKKKLLLILASLMLMLAWATPVLASQTTTYTSNYKYVVDMADVLSDAEEKQLNDKISDIYNTYGYDLVIVTTVGVSQSQRMSYADDFYDYNGYSGNGALLLTNIQPDGSYTTNNSWISTAGTCIKCISDDDIQSIGSDITPYLTSGKYYNAFDKFIDKTADTVSFNKSFNKGTKVVILLSCTLIIGLIGAFCYTKSLKNQLISVKEARDANNYLVDGSLTISQSRDTFLYSNVVRTPKPKSNGGSSTHTSSSGSSHGGGGF